jgi:hypothetical protein
MCACISARPGIRNLPLPSTRVAPSGIFAASADPTHAIFWLRTITVWFGTTASLSIGSTETPTNAVVAW